MFYINFNCVKVRLYILLRFLISTAFWGASLIRGRCSNRKEASRRRRRSFFTSEDTTIKNSSSKKLPGVLINDKLTFNDHVSKLCQKASQKVHALVRVSNFMSEEKLRILMNAFFTSLVWMFHSRTLNCRINNLQERALQLVYNDSSSSFSELLKKDYSFTIHYRNILQLVIEIHKVKHHEAPK